MVLQGKNHVGVDSATATTSKKNCHPQNALHFVFSNGKVFCSALPHQKKIITISIECGMYQLDNTDILVTKTFSPNQVAK